MLETAARPIGGLCAKTLRFGGTPMRNSSFATPWANWQAGRPVGPPAPLWTDRHSGVMMIPIPQAGIYESVEGVDRATAVPGIEAVIVTAQPGQELIPLPEGASYLGFIFARGESPAEVEAALRQSHAQLRFRIGVTLATFRP